MNFPSLTFNQTNDVMKRFPAFELSYENISHKKVSEHYDVTLAIPYGKKVMLWYTFFKNKDVCFLMDLDKNKKVNNIQIIQDSNIPQKLAYGTILYGCICEIPDLREFFVIEDIFYYCGNMLYKQHYQEKLQFIQKLFQEYEDCFHKNESLPCVMPVFWSILEDQNSIPLEYKGKIPYSIHHLQHRSYYKTVPFINFPWSKNLIPSIGKNPLEIPNELLFIPPPLPRFHFGKPQYKEKTVFEIKADLQNDIYHLYAFGKGSERIYCGIAYISNYKTSKYMNQLFRNIKENRNLDSLEESDDEEDFQDLRIDKYVNLQKKFAIECEYKPKFRKWAPIRKIDGRGQIVHIRNL